MNEDFENEIVKCLLDNQKKHLDNKKNSCIEENLCTEENYWMDESCKKVLEEKLSSEEMKKIDSVYKSMLIGRKIMFKNLMKSFEDFKNREKTEEDHVQSKVSENNQ